MTKRGQSGGDDWVQPNTKLSEEEQVIILRKLKDGASQSEIAAHLGRHASCISRFIKRYFPTNELAEAYLRKNALTLAKKVVKHSTVEEAIEVLSRPNIGVLAPQKTVETGPRILISVGQDSVGAIESGQRNHLGLTAGSSGGIMASGSHDAVPKAIPAAAQEREAHSQEPAIAGRAEEYLPSTRPVAPPASARRSVAHADSRVDSRTGRRHLKAVSAPIDKKDRVREVIPGRVKGRARGSSGIHLRYDIVEKEDE